MGYAQIDPLVVYKKEAFEKFQQLLLRLKQNVTMYLMNFDFSGNSSVQVVQESSDGYLDVWYSLGADATYLDRYAVGCRLCLSLFHATRSAQENDSVVMYRDWCGYGTLLRSAYYSYTFSIIRSQSGNELYPGSSG